MAPNGEDAWHRSLRAYKYQTLRPLVFKLQHVRSSSVIKSGGGYVTLMRDELFVGKGYAWDGASGPTFDTPSTMRASLCHDALYQLLREERLPAAWRKKCDLELAIVAQADGMPAWRARLWVRALGLFGGAAARPRS